MLKNLFLTTCFIFSFVFLAEAQFRRNRESQAQPAASEGNLNYANPKEYTIAGIDVTGLNILDKNALVS